MLYEIPHPGRLNHHHEKRCFTSCDMDLFAWFSDDVPVRFQLTYDKRRQEKAINWGFDRVFRHYLIDSGEDFPSRHPGHYKQTPILTNSCEQQTLSRVARDFLAASQHIDTGISDFIYARLMAHPTTTSKHCAVNTDRFRGK